MASFLRKLFGKPPAIEQLARRGDREAFLRTLGEADIFVIAAIEGDGLDASTMTKEQLLAEIERAAKDLNERQDGFAPFVYERNGRRRLPFFTSNAHAETFVGKYSKERNRVYPFQLLRVKGALLAQLMPACDDLAMDDRTEAEVVLSEPDMAAMRRMWG
ncbi:MAG: hypothetical protein QOH06_854 [Acidobacteriota bacterium]|jgi:hypothetical protein|nr:hypothetical protein [Acidobacteriota bacterium]